jgi:uncharacterized protein YdcH (DUF465 family)
MSAPSHDELDKLAEDVGQLRDKIANAESTRAEREDEASRELRYQQLTAEKTRLEAELAAATASAKVGAVKAGTADLLQSAKDQVAQATALAEQPVGPVDTTVGTPVNVSDNGAENPLTADSVTTDDKPKNGGNS